MQVGILQFFGWTRRVPIETVYARALERVAIMDEGGYDAVWLAEHHFNTYSVCPSMHLMAMHVADRTKNLRIGTAVTLAAFHHPLRIAEDIAMLDVLSGGRVNWGAGRGFDQVEFRAFDVPVEESADRFREAVDVVLGAWTSERLNHHGRFWHFDDVEVLPRPLQKPHPPVWLAATSPASVRRAAADGFTILMDPHATHAEIGEKRRLYRQTLEEHGHSAEGRVIPTARLLAIAPTRERALEVARNGASWTLGSYIMPDKNSSAGVVVRQGEDPVDRYVNDVIIAGTPDEVVDRILGLRDSIGLDYLLGAPLSHESFLLFTREVLPRLV